MSICGVRPRQWLATYFAFSAFVFASLSASAVAQSPSDASSGYSSSTSGSTSGLMASNDSLASLSGLATSSSIPSISSAPTAASGLVSGSGAVGGQYSGGSHSFWNASHIAFEAGAGANAPIGNDHPFITWGGNFTVGAGLKFNPHISGLIEYQFIDDKLPGSLIADAGAQGGHAHIWSLTMEPVIYLFPKHKTDAYVTGGGGFYRKVTSFTDPEQVEQCYYFCVVGTENVVVSHFSSNQGGLNIGAGITHRFGGMYGDSNMKLFAEARYLWINTPGFNQTDGLGTTGLIPVTFGVRF